MQFIKYPSLTNHYVARKQRFINFDNEYVSTEKNSRFKRINYC